MPSGKYAGTPISGVPPGYLRRLSATKGKLGAMAKLELIRRGIEAYSIEVTAHAVDRASLRLGAQWAQHSEAGEGIHAWLGRMAEEALDKLDPLKRVGNMTVSHWGIVFAFDFKFATPVLMSVWLSKDPKED